MLVIAADSNDAVIGFIGSMIGGSAGASEAAGLGRGSFV